ncbi:MAG: phosphoglucomutase/phosphomannomutase family protein [Chloroflexi bacterium]|nr:MAG: phosphoglucomutase/phosphomannomutase family protein [Chloroflexota bacterium]
MPIRFGTDGWRAIISDEFTFENVRHVSQAIADWLIQGSHEGTLSVVVGFDTRFLSDRYAMEVARVLAGNGIHVHLTKADCPTPALSFAVHHLQADFGVMLTASHNPPRYNGIKLKAPYGGSALPATTKQVESRLHTNLDRGRMPQAMDYDEALAAGLIERFDPMPAYLTHVESLVDFDRIRANCPRVLVDPMYGAGRGYIRSFLDRAGGCADEIHGDMNPGFAGIHPEPIGRNLGELIAQVQAGGYDMGLATDGDADRIGAVDAHGRFVTPHLIYALILRHLVEDRGWTGAVVKTVSTTQLVNRLAERYQLPLHETPVGSNYLCELMLANDVLIAGEESGGITIKHHIPEGDGILMGLLLTEIVAHHRQPLHKIVADLLADLGPVAYARNDVRAKRPFSKPELVARLMRDAPAELAGRPVVHINDADGIKYVLEDGSWLLIRPSGTEPVLRIYAEAPDEAGVQALLRAGAVLAGVSERGPAGAQL